MPHPGKTAVYEFFDSRGRHLYIGITNSPAHRFDQHALDKWWWQHVDHGRTRITWHPTRSKALRIEKRKIQAQCPPGNTQHNPRAGRTYRSSSPRRAIARMHPAMRPACVSFACFATLFGSTYNGMTPPPGVGIPLFLVGVIAGLMAWSRR